MESRLAFISSPPSRTLRNSSAFSSGPPPRRSSTLHRSMPTSRGSNMNSLVSYTLGSPSGATFLISKMVAGPRGLISSNPTPWMTTAWSTRPTSLRAPAMRGTRCSPNTPMTALCAPAALVMGPKILKHVRTPNRFRTGATKRMAGWLTGANMKAMPHCSTHLTTSAGFRSALTPRASRTSALPHALETLRLPALATVQPHAAASTTLAVDMLMVSAPSPPVPTMSSALTPSGSRTALHAAFMARTMPAISAGVSPRARRRVRRQPTWISSAPARMVEKAS
mmetsp:Transcript_5710/g.16063  ORF Transcript_5710/g.16063 Transcript_5710/m.16063 type:complete len:281 (-) Transcript_5710:298-1140(-)